MSQSQLMEIWQCGARLKAVYLGQFYYLTDAEILRACRQIAEPHGASQSGVDALFEALREVEEAVLPREDYWKEQVDFEPHGTDAATWQSHLAVVTLLQNEALTGLGFSHPRSPEDPVHAIPPDLWHADIDWERDSVSGNGLSFTGVRIVPALSEQALAVLPEPPARSETVEKNRPGRPSKKGDIIAAYEALDVEPQ